MNHLSRIVILFSLILLATACSSDSTPGKTDNNDRDTGHHDASEQDTNHQDTNQQDTSQQDASKQDASKQDTSQSDTKDNEDENDDPNCHHDCWTGYLCKDGNVYKGAGNTLPCSESSDEDLLICDAGFLIGSCDEGCVENTDNSITDELPDGVEDSWKVLCNEGLPDTEEPPNDCTITLELKDSLIIIATTWPTPIAANSQPTICWKNSQDTKPPATENGWELHVEREEKAGGNVDNSAWFVTGMPAETLQIQYGNCNDAESIRCTTADTLTKGSYFIHVLEPNNPNGLAASLVVKVE